MLESFIFLCVCVCEFARVLPKLVALDAMPSNDVSEHKP